MLAIDAAPEDADKLFDHLDADGGGSIDYNELKRGLRRPYIEPEPEPEIIE